jgi:menaquinol-cytochrome c reductase iron-sulfur subunit
MEVARGRRRRSAGRGGTVRWLHGSLGTAPITRRRMLEGTLAWVTAAIAAALGIPALAAWISPALRKETQDWVPVGSLADPGPGQPDLNVVGEPVATSFTRLVQDAYLAAQPQPVAVFVVNHGDGKFTVFDNRCTHLGCPVNWTGESRQYFSPCHGGVFDEDGRVLGGPPPRPLDRYAYKVEQDVLYAGELFQVNENLQRITQ